MKPSKDSKARQRQKLEQLERILGPTTVGGPADDLNSRPSIDAIMGMTTEELRQQVLVQSISADNEIETKVKFSDDLRKYERVVEAQKALIAKYKADFAEVKNIVNVFVDSAKPEEAPVQYDHENACSWAAGCNHGIQICKKIIDVAM